MRKFVPVRGKLLTVTIFLVTMLGYLFGYLVGNKHIPPYLLMKQLEDVFLKSHEVYFKLDPVASDVDLEELIEIKNEEDVFKKRRRLIKYIWGDKGFPATKIPSLITENIDDSRYSDLKNLKSIDLLTISMEQGLKSLVYHFLPKENRNNKLIIYQQGHRGDFIHGKGTINYFLKRGYSVLAFSMPLLGLNNKPTINVKRFGKIRLKVHEDLKLLNLPIRPFVEPIAVSLNFVSSKFKYNNFAMVGISGGAWTTYLYSAIDPRIIKSYPVAGGYPLFLTTLQNYLPDYEFYSIEMLRIANYLELFILGSYGKGRKQLQIFNQFDPLISNGILFQTYEKHLDSLISRLGKGKFKVHLDSTHREHIISKHALEIILRDMEENKI